MMLKFIVGIIFINLFVGIGSAYISKPFNYQTNYLNIAIGLHINMYANINLEAQIRMPHFIFYTDFGITHFSNGGTKHPNLGLNIPAISMGVKYKTFNIVKKVIFISSIFKIFHE